MMKTAQELFRVGDRVRLSGVGRVHHCQFARNNVRGTVMGLGRDVGRSSALKVRILMDGTVQTRSYPVRHFEVDPDAAPAPTMDSATAVPPRSGQFRARKQASAE